MSFGSPFRLNDTEDGITTMGGTLQQMGPFARLSAGNRTYVLGFRQEVLTSKGFKTVESIQSGDKIVPVSHNPVKSGTAHVPNTSFILGVMERCFNDKFQLISGNFNPEERKLIEDSLSLVHNELGQTVSKATPNPKFVRQSTTDNPNNFVLTSPLFRMILAEARRLELVTYAGHVKGDAVTKATFLSWMDGYSIASGGNLPKGAQALNLNTPPSTEQRHRFLISNEPVFIDEDLCLEVTDVRVSAVETTALYVFDAPFWVCPDYQYILQYGVLCKNI